MFYDTACFIISRYKRNSLFALAKLYKYILMWTLNASFPFITNKRNTMNNIYREDIRKIMRVSISMW